MNILIVSQYFWPEEFRVNDLALSLAERGHKVAVLTGIPNYPHGKFFDGYGLFKPHRQEHYGVSVIRVPLIPRGDGKKLGLMLNYSSFACIGSCLAPFRLRGKFDLIIATQFSPATAVIPAVLLKKIKQIPLIVWIQDLWPDSLSATGAIKSPRVLGLVGKMMRWIYGNCDQILVQSKGFCSPIESQGIRTDKIRYFPNWAEDLYKQPECADLLEIPLPTGFRIMFAGNIGAAQDFGTILDAAERLREFTDIQWLILGDGRMRSWVEEQVRNRGLRNVHLLGRHPVEAMPHFFSVADVMLVSLRREPIFSLTIPSKIQSYMASSRPIIASLDGEGARVVEESGSGVTCPPEDAAALANAVIHMYNIPVSEREAMGLRGRAYFDTHFDRQLLLDRLEVWMEEATGQASQRL